MAARRRHQHLVVESHAFDPQRLSPAELNRDLHVAEDDIEELKRSRRCLGVALAIVSGLLVLGLLAAYLWIGLSNRAQDGNVNNLAVNVTLLQQNTMQLFLEWHGITTVLQQGNFTWVMAMNDVGVSPDACVTPAAWISTPAQASYQLQNVLVGGLNFTVLELQPPSSPLVYVNTTDLLSLLRVCLIQFVPPVDNVDQFAVNGPHTMEFTTANAARLSLTPNCVGDGTCYVAPVPAEGYTGTPAYGIQPSQTVPDAPGESLLDFYYAYTSGQAPLGASFTLTDPLRLVMFSS